MMQEVEPTIDGPDDFPIDDLDVNNTYRKRRYFEEPLSDPLEESREIGARLMDTRRVNDEIVKGLIELKTKDKKNWAENYFGSVPFVEGTAGNSFAVPENEGGSSASEQANQLWNYVPVLGHFASADQNRRMKSLVDRFKSRDPSLNTGELNRIATHAALEINRSKSSVGAFAAEMAAYSPTFGAEMAISGGLLKGLGLMKYSKTSAAPWLSKSQRTVRWARDVASPWMKDAAKVAALGSASGGALENAMARDNNEIGSLQFFKNRNETISSIIQDIPDEDFWTQSLPKGFVSSFNEYFSEQLGVPILKTMGFGGKVAKTVVPRQVKEFLVDRYLQAFPTARTSKSFKHFTEVVQFHGFAEPVEERANEVLNYVAGKSLQATVGGGAISEDLGVTQHLPAAILSRIRGSELTDDQRHAERQIAAELLHTFGLQAGPAAVNYHHAKMMVRTQKDLFFGEGYPEATVVNVDGKNAVFSPMTSQPGVDVISEDQQGNLKREQLSHLRWAIRSGWQRSAPIENPSETHEEGLAVENPEKALERLESFLESGRKKKGKPSRRDMFKTIFSPEEVGYTLNAKERALVYEAAKAEAPNIRNAISSVKVLKTETDSRAEESVQEAYDNEALDETEIPKEIASEESPVSMIQVSSAKDIDTLFNVEPVMIPDSVKDEIEGKDEDPLVFFRQSLKDAFEGNTPSYIEKNKEDPLIKLWLDRIEEGKASTRQEEVKQEEVKQEEVKQEEVKQEEVKQEEVKQEEVKQELLEEDHTQIKDRVSRRLGYKIKSFLPAETSNEKDAETLASSLGIDVLFFNDDKEANPEKRLKGAFQIHKKKPLILIRKGSGNETWRVMSHELIHNFKISLKDFKKETKDRILLTKDAFLKNLPKNSSYHTLSEEKLEEELIAQHFDQSFSSQDYKKALGLKGDTLWKKIVDYVKSVFSGNLFSTGGTTDSARAILEKLGEKVEAKRASLKAEQKPTAKDTFNPPEPNFVKQEDFVPVDPEYAVREAESLIEPVHITDIILDDNGSERLQLKILTANGVKSFSGYYAAIPVTDLNPIGVTGVEGNESKRLGFRTKRSKHRNKKRPAGLMNLDQYKARFLSSRFDIEEDTLKELMEKAGASKGFWSLHNETLAKDPSRKSAFTLYPQPEGVPSDISVTSQADGVGVPVITATGHVVQNDLSATALQLLTENQLLEHNLKAHGYESGDDVVVVVLDKIHENSPEAAEISQSQLLDSAGDRALWSTPPVKVDEKELAKEAKLEKSQSPMNMAMEELLSVAREWAGWTDSQRRKSIVQQMEKRMTIPSSEKVSPDSPVQFLRSEDWEKAGATEMKPFNLKKPQSADSEALALKELKGIREKEKRQQERWDKESNMTEEEKKEERIKGLEEERRAYVASLAERRVETARTTLNDGYSLTEDQLKSWIPKDQAKQRRIVTEKLAKAGIDLNRVGQAKKIAAKNKKKNKSVSVPGPAEKALRTMRLYELFKLKHGSDFAAWFEPLEKEVWSSSLHGYPDHISSAAKTSEKKADRLSNVKKDLEEQEERDVVKMPPKAPVSYEDALDIIREDMEVIENLELKDKAGSKDADAASGQIDQSFVRLLATGFLDRGVTTKDGPERISEVLKKLNERGDLISETRQKELAIQIEAMRHIGEDMSEIDDLFDTSFTGLEDDLKMQISQIDEIVKELDEDLSALEESDAEPSKGLLGRLAGSVTNMFRRPKATTKHEELIPPQARPYFESQDRPLERTKESITDSLMRLFRVNEHIPSSWKGKEGFFNAFEQILRIDTQSFPKANEDSQRLIERYTLFINQKGEKGDNDRELFRKAVVLRNLYHAVYLRGEPARFNLTREEVKRAYEKIEKEVKKGENINVQKALKARQDVVRMAAEEAVNEGLLSEDILLTQEFEGTEVDKVMYFLHQVVDMQIVASRSSYLKSRKAGIEGLPKEFDYSTNVVEADKNFLMMHQVRMASSKFHKRLSGSDYNKYSEFKEDAQERNYFLEVLATDGKENLAADWINAVQEERLLSSRDMHDRSQEEAGRLKSLKEEISDLEKKGAERVSRFKDALKALQDYKESGRSYRTPEYQALKEELQASNPVYAGRQEKNRTWRKLISAVKKDKVPLAGDKKNVLSSDSENVDWLRTLELHAAGKPNFKEILDDFTREKENLEKYLNLAFGEKAGNDSQRPYQANVATIVGLRENREDYALYNVNAARAFLMASYNPTEHIMNKMMRDVFHTMEMPLDDLMNNLFSSVDTKSKSLQTMVLPKPIVDQLNQRFKTIENLMTPQAMNVAKDLVKGGLAVVKPLLLLAPQRAIGYYIRNVFGDLDAVIGSNPEIFWNKDADGKRTITTFIAEAARETKEYFDARNRLKKNPEMSMEEYLGSKNSDLNQAMSMHALQSSLIDYDSPTISETKAFLQFFKDVGDIDMKTASRRAFKKVEGIYKWYFDFAAKKNHYREMVFRLAAYKHFKSKMNKLASITGDGARKSAFKKMRLGATNRTKAWDTLEQLGPNEAAALLSREVLLDYNDLTQSGRFARDFLFPFHSWAELNFRRYYNILNNAWNDFKDGGSVGSLASQGVFGGLGLAKTAAVPLAGVATKVFFFYGMVKLWNLTMQTYLGIDPERDYGAADRETLHILMPWKSSNGDVVLLRNPSAIGDVMNWLGLGEAFEGEVGLRPQAANFVNKFYQSSHPLWKGTLEVSSGRSGYPDFFNQRPQYRDELLAGSIGFKDSWKELKGSMFGGGSSASPGSLARFASTSLAGRPILPWKTIGSFNPTQQLIFNARGIYSKYDSDGYVRIQQLSNRPNFKRMNNAVMHDDKMAFLRACKQYKRDFPTDANIYESFTLSLSHLQIFNPNERDDFFEAISEKERLIVSAAESAVQKNKQTLATWFGETLNETVQEEKMAVAYRRANTLAGGITGNTEEEKNASKARKKKAFQWLKTHGITKEQAIKGLQHEKHRLKTHKGRREKMGKFNRNWALFEKG